MQLVRTTTNKARDYFKENFGLHINGERRARAYNEGIGTEPQRGEAEPMVTGQGPSETEGVLAFGCQK